jgi:hypothetical protein
MEINERPTLIISSNLLLKLTRFVSMSAETGFNRLLNMKGINPPASVASI